MKPGASSGSTSRKQRSFATTSTASGSLAKVESIFIDIVAAEQIKPKKCEHFTIRGFVCDSREQNDKLCLPLFVDSDASSSKTINLTHYPLHAPYFKSWQCENCLNEIGAAAGKKGSHNFSVSCSKQVKAKSFRSQRSLENVVAYLSEKLKQTSELGRIRTLCQAVKSTSKFKQKQKPNQKQKQKLNSALNSNTGGLYINEMHNAATCFIPNQQDSLKCVDKHQKESSRPHTTITSSKFILVDGSQIKARHGAASNLVQGQHDDSVGSCCRKTKAKKVRLLNEILEKDGRVAQKILTDEPAKASCSALQSLQKIHFDNARWQAGLKRNDNGQEQDRNWSQIHFANTVDGNSERRKAEGLNSSIANELHMSSNDGQSNPIHEQADKMFFGGKQKVDGRTNHPHRGQKTNNNLCLGQEQLSTRQPFHGRVADSLHNDSMPHSKFNGESDDTVHKVHAGENLLTLTDNGRRLETNVTQKRMDTFQIGQAQWFQSTQDGNFSRQPCSVTEGYLDPRKSTGGWFPSTQNGNLRNDTRLYVGESSSTCKSLVDKNISLGTNSISALKRPNQGPCGDNKKTKHSRRTKEGPTVVHQMELLIRNSNKKMRGVRGNPENTLCEIRGSRMQEVGTSDDIPMEIVELMAKNQYERHLHEVGDNHYEQQSGSYQKKILVGETSILPSDVSQGSAQEKPHLPSAHITLEAHLGISNEKPMGNILQRPSGKARRPLIPGALQFSAMGSSKADISQIQNSIYDMNKSASQLRVPSRSQGQFELWQPTSQTSVRTERPWPMVTPNNPVHKPSVFHGNSLQSFNYREIPNSSYVGEGRSFSKALAEKKTNNVRPEASHTPYPNKVDGRPQVTGSPDPYANEAIPAMNLLSLMNGRPQSSTQINIDAVANRKSFDRSFSNDHLAKELSGNSFAAGKSDHKLKQSSLYGYQSKNPLPVSSCQCSPPVPTFSSASASLHGGDKRGVQPLSQHRERVFSNMSPSSSLLPNGTSSIMYQQSPFTSTIGVAFQQLIPAHELASHIFSPSWPPMPGSGHLYINGNFNGYHNLVANESFVTVDKCAERGVCCLNRNPMEFSTPGPGNEFMISPEELKVRKTYHANFTRPMATSSFKQQGFIKYAAPNNRL